MLPLLDAPAVRRWCGAAASALAERRAEIDALNVYPIPDGDTGTNLDLTLRSALEALKSAHPDVGSAAGEGAAAGAGVMLAAMAHGAVLGARGNSGVIVSQILRGMADAVGTAGTVDGPLLAAALEAACDAAYAAVAKPVEGTILSVLRCAAAESRLAVGDQAGSELGKVVAAAAAGGAEALARTPEQLDVLAAAGVVDAGGQGLVVILNALAEVVTGRDADRDVAAAGSTANPATAAQASTTVPPATTVPAATTVPPSTVRHSAPEYEVQYLLRSDEAAVLGLKKVLAELGDSLAVVGTGSGVFNVHVHVDDVGAAIEAGIEAGVPHRISVVRFADRRQPAAQRSGTALVAVAPGEGLGKLFRSEGVTVVEGGMGDNPSTAEVLAGILAVEAARVILLPNAAAVRGVAELAAEQARQQGIEVAVVPTKSPLQGLAAVAVHDPDRRFEDDVIALAEAAAATRFAEVTVALRESITYAGRCSAGDVLGLIDGEVVRIGSDIREVGIDLVNRLIAAGGELVTVVSGAGFEAANAATELETYVKSVHPLVDISVFSGGQPHFPLLLGVE